MQPLLLNADSLDALKDFESNSIDAVITDPPYGLSNIKPSGYIKVMQKWSNGELSYVPKKQGFVGNGWDSFVPPPALFKEVLRVLKPGAHAFVFASSRTQDLMGLSLRISGFEIRDCIQWIYGTGFPKSRNLGSGWGTTLKPAYEPILLVRKPLETTATKNFEQWGTGGLNIDACRVGDIVQDTSKNGRAHKNSLYKIGFKKEFEGKITVGRFPANVILDPTIHEEWNQYFYCAKASKKEKGAYNTHPTVKPLDLIQYLCRLITSSSGIVLDPFMGSGTTGVASIREGFSFVGIEREKEYYDIATKRINSRDQ